VQHVVTTVTRDRRVVVRARTRLRLLEQTHPATAFTIFAHVASDTALLGNA
jgi:hypothetical protein